MRGWVTSRNNALQDKATYGICECTGVWPGLTMSPEKWRHLFPHLWNRPAVNHVEEFTTGVINNGDPYQMTLMDNRTASEHL